MRRQLIATTALIALTAILILGIPLGLVESARARSDALGRLEREADGIAAAVGGTATAPRQLDPAALSRWLRPEHAAVVHAGGASVRLGRVPAGAHLSARSGASQGVRVTVVASAAEVTRRRRQVWLLVGGLAIAGTAAAAGLATLRELTPAAYARLDALGARLTRRLADRIAQDRLDARVVNVGSLFQVFRGEAGAAFAPGAERPSEVFLGLLLEGFYLAPRGMGAIPTVATELDVDDLADAIARVLGAMSRAESPTLVAGSR